MSEKLCCPWENLFYEPALLDSASGDADNNDTVDYYLSRIKSTETNILDIGCGTGRLTIPLAANGYQIYAVDRSSKVVDFFRHKLAHLNPELQERIYLDCLDIQTSKYQKPADVAIAVDDFLTHFLNEESLRNVLQNIALSLKPKGRFLTDLRGRSPSRMAIARQDLPKPMLFFGMVHQVATSKGDRSVAMRSVEDYDRDRQILSSNQIFEWILPDGTVEKSIYRTLRQRLYSEAELTNIAFEAGLELTLATKRLNPEQKPSFEAGVSLEFCKRKVQSK